MADKKNIHTTFTNGKWNSKREGQHAPLSTHRTKETAVNASIKQAKKDKVEHIIHGKGGRIQDKDSYGPDTCPPKDKKH